MHNIGAVDIRGKTFPHQCTGIQGHDQCDVLLKTVPVPSLSSDYSVQCDSGNLHQLPWQTHSTGLLQVMFQLFNLVQKNTVSTQTHYPDYPPCICLAVPNAHPKSSTAVSAFSLPPVIHCSKMTCTSGRFRSLHLPDICHSGERR